MTEQFNKTPIGVLCAQFTQTLIAHPMSLYFRKPTTDESYLQIIKNPMDFDTIRKKLKDGQYLSHNEWKKDVYLIYSNAIDYNTRESVAGGMAIYLQKKTDKMCQKFNYFNHQNYEEAIRSLNRELDSIVSQITQQNIDITPSYEIEQLSKTLNNYSDTSEIEQLIKKSGDHRILKKCKDGVINLDSLSRKTLDLIWNKFGKPQ